MIEVIEKVIIKIKINKSMANFPNIKVYLVVSIKLQYKLCKRKL